jgi:putative FmdB family regulatory protein
MPVYEFYCPDCHRIFNFMARRMNTTKRPDCPKCGRPKLDRKVSLFTVPKGRKEPEEEGPMPDIDESRMMRAMESLAKEAEGMDEDDPRQAAGLMKKLYDATGLKLGPGMKEAIQRMEGGEDPEQIEEDLGDLLEAEDPFALGDSAKELKGLKGLRKKVLPPSTDETLYEL